MNFWRNAWPASKVLSPTPAPTPKHPLWKWILLKSVGLISKWAFRAQLWVSAQKNCTCLCSGWPGISNRHLLWPFHLVQKPYMPWANHCSLSCLNPNLHDVQTEGGRLAAQHEAADHSSCLSTAVTAQSLQQIMHLPYFYFCRLLFPQ